MKELEMLHRALTATTALFYTKCCGALIMIEYISRYSETEKPDNLGRWARIVTVNDIQIAWINRLEIKGDVRYSAGCYFPTRKHTDTPREHKLFTDFESAKDYVAERWEWFLNNMVSV